MAHFETKYRPTPSPRMFLYSLLKYYRELVCTINLNKLNSNSDCVQQRIHKYVYLARGTG